MKFSRFLAAACAGLATAGVLTAAAFPQVAHASRHPAGMRAACPQAPAGGARCYALYGPQLAVNEAIAARTADKHVSISATTPKGWGARSIESAYRLPVADGAGQTIAVVDALSTPNLSSDLAVYRRQYGLPPCTAASGCLRIVNQQGNPTPLPTPDPFGWGVEETYRPGHPRRHWGVLAIAPVRSPACCSARPGRAARCSRSLGRSRRR